MSKNVIKMYNGYQLNVNGGLDVEILNLAQVAGLEQGQWLIARNGQIGKESENIVKRSLSCFGSVKHFFGFGEAGYYTLRSAVERAAEEKFQKIINSFQGCAAPKDLLSVRSESLPDIKAAFAQIAQVQKERVNAQKKLDELFFKVDNWTSRACWVAEVSVRSILEVGKVAFRTFLLMFTPGAEVGGWNGFTWMNWAKDDCEASLPQFYKLRIAKLIGNKRVIPLFSNERYKAFFKLIHINFAPSFDLNDNKGNILGGCSFYPLLNKSLIDVAALGAAQEDNVDLVYNLITALRVTLLDNPDPVLKNRLKKYTISLAYNESPDLEMSEGEARELSVWTQNFYNDTPVDKRQFFCLPDISKAQAAVQRVLNPS